MTGIYIHVPFCLRKCPYCDFYSGIFSLRTAEEYTEAVQRNIKAYKGRNIPVDTVYFGGGTPSLLTPAQIASVIDCCDDSFKLVEPEITLECNPSSIDRDKLRSYLSAGVNRLSVGVQSADDDTLVWLGRLHDKKTAFSRIYDAAEVGFKNISCDMIIGAAGQNEKRLVNEIVQIAALPVEHISAYMLKIEQGTAFDCEEIRTAAADAELMCSLYLTAVETLTEYGFEQYEISNFARHGRQSRHNLKYWQGEEYIGIGPAAHSYFDGARYFCPADTEDFIHSDIQRRTVQEENVDRAEEYVMLGLRLTEGISISKAQSLGLSQPAADHMRLLAAEMQKHGLCRTDGNVIRLTPQGFLLSEEITVRLLYW